MGIIRQVRTFVCIRALKQQIKNIENKLRNYENILKLYQKSIKLKEIIEDIKNEKIRKALIKIFFD